MSRPDQSDERTAERAAEFIVNGEEPNDGEQQLVAWLSESPKNVGEYVRMSALWEVLADPRLDVSAFPARPRFPRRHWLAVAAALVLAVGLGWWTTTRPEVYRTAVGEVKSFALPDRSVVFLNADSRIAVRYSETQRRIVLESGDALFDVARDAERPFVVVCGETRVTAVGTKFTVGRRAGQTTVTLIEGKVVVAEPRLGEDAKALVPGQRLTMEESGVMKVVAVDPRDVAPWRHRRLIFDSNPLSEVASEFNRFNRPAIRIEGDALKNLRISGVFDANDPESLLAYLRTLEGVEVTIQSDGTATLRRR